MDDKKLEYKVGFFRALGYEAKWTRTRANAPIIAVKTDAVDRKSGKPIWAVVTDKIWERAKSVGFKQAFDESTAFIDIFSIPA